MDMNKFFKTENWKIVHTKQLPALEGKYFSFDNLPVTSPAKNYLIKRFPNGIYEHQMLAIHEYLESRHVCLTTGTASGKSLVFYLSGIDLLTKVPGSKILALYPLRALAKEQEERWKKAFEDAGVEATVGRIDGQIPTQERLGIIRRSDVLITTPDIIHAWMFSQISQRPVQDFLKKLNLVIVDEVHTYTGVFGSNCGFLFRRLRHILKLFGKEPLFICASATIADSKGHLSKLFGIDFEIVGHSKDTSPRKPVEIDLIYPPLAKDLFSEISYLLSYLSKDKSNRFIAFVDSRKQTELLASIVSRENDDTKEVESEIDGERKFKWDRLQELNILPYRAGYEEDDRLAIQGRLSNGTLAGVISTSALELGIDIPHLTIGVLVGVPYSSTSFFQRIGRIGRHALGHIFIISRGNVFDETLFAEPEELLNRPLAEGALYLENQRIQYIHALCLARQGGEHDQIINAKDSLGEEEFTSPITWPHDFLELCTRERIGEIPRELQTMKSEAGEDPNHIFPLRDVEVQFRVRYQYRGQEQKLGSLSHSQLMREAYPGAVYYYTAQPYRVVRVNVRSREVDVRHEKRYTTSPIQLPTMIFPNLAPENIFKAKIYGKIICMECNLQVHEKIIGYKEKRGPTEEVFHYPIDSSNPKTSGIYFDRQKFSRSYFTTGIILTHPILNKNKDEADLICSMLFEAFLMILPFERRDISFGIDKHRMAREQFGIEKESKFIAIYDQTYGSLRLTSRLLVDDTLRLIIEKAIEICKVNKIASANKEIIKDLEVLLDDAKQKTSDYDIHVKEERHADENLVKVILENSKGLAICSGNDGKGQYGDNKEFLVIRIFFDPKTQKLSYRGRFTDEKYRSETAVHILAVDKVIEIPGESSMGYYSMGTGEIKNI